MTSNPLQLFRLLLCALLVTISLHNAIGQFSNCPKCMCTRPMIHCNRNDRVKMIPEHVGRQYTNLIIQHADFTDYIIYKRNMTYLSHLVELKINYCNLRSVGRFAFEDMKLLKILDLSYNNILTVQPYAFSGLNLNQLYLGNNFNIRIYDHSFIGMNTTELSLRSCGIDEIPYNSVKNLHLSKLLLFNNSIRELDWRFEKIFDSPNKLIDLTSNPLHCNCQITWLLHLIKKWALGKDSLGSINMTCGSPAILTGRELSKLKQNQLPCTKPYIQGVDLDIHASGSIQLICKSLGYPAPGLFWSYLGEDGDRRELKRSPVRADTFSRLFSAQDYLYPPTVNYKETSLTLKVNMTPSIRRNYTCTTWNEINDQQTLVVSVKGPPLSKGDYDRFPIRKVYNQNNQVQFEVLSDENHLKSLQKQNSKDESVRSYRDETENNNNRPPQSFSDYIFQKQFTLVEMIGAVVGTFAVTLGLLLIVSRCIIQSRMKRNKNQKTYWTVNGSAAYSATGSHEYDVPRLDHVSYQPAKLNEIEFLDFKTQRKLYTGT